MSAATLAEKIGLSQQQLSKCERGINRISVNNIQVISRILDTPISWFFMDCFPIAEKNTINNYSTPSLDLESAELKKRFDMIIHQSSYKKNLVLFNFLDSLLNE
ncbi:helix-turn-helix domain-containing protein (plasmid) [Xenorhabdus stockiae]|uniref:helix-turn-helix domain-containing protein n=1 Tax=Xenorhabdus stockiae TaxID=351614 RepID=UPI003CF73BB8